MKSISNSELRKQYGGLSVEELQQLKVACENILKDTPDDDEAKATVKVCDELLAEKTKEAAKAPEGFIQVRAGKQAVNVDGTQIEAGKTGYIRPARLKSLGNLVTRIALFLLLSMLALSTAFADPTQGPQYQFGTITTTNALMPTCDGSTNKCLANSTNTLNKVIPVTRHDKVTIGFGFNYLEAGTGNQSLYYTKSVTGGNNFKDTTPTIVHLAGNGTTPVYKVIEITADATGYIIINQWGNTNAAIPATNNFIHVGYKPERHWND